MSNSNASTRGSGGGASLKDTKNTTGTLQRTRQVMERNLNRMDTAMRQLSQDGELIKDSLDEHAVELKGALRSTKTNLNTVKTAEVWERYSLKAALAFFFSVVFYIICKRTRILALAVFTLNQLFFKSPAAFPDHFAGPVREHVEHSVLDVLPDSAAAAGGGGVAVDIENEEENSSVLSGSPGSDKVGAWEAGDESDNSAADVHSAAADVHSADDVHPAEQKEQIPNEGDALQEEALAVRGDALSVLARSDTGGVVNSDTRSTDTTIDLFVEVSGDTDTDTDTTFTDPISEVTAEPAVMTVDLVMDAIIDEFAESIVS
jgi:hypothetical protein